MKRKGHFFWTTIYISIITYYLDPLALLFWFVSLAMAWFPDVDYGDNHRFWLTHSIILPLIAWIFFPYILTLLILLAIGHHLALDTVGNLIFGKKAVGYYTIVLIPSIEINFWLFKIKTRNYRLSGKLSTIWLLSNWMITLIILGVVLIT